MSEFFFEKPPNFHVAVEVSTVFMEYEKKLLLLLLRSKHCTAPESWAIPGGKLQGNETPLEGLMREIWEELLLQPNSADLSYIGVLYVHHSLAKYKLHLFRWQLASNPHIVINYKEHQNFLWQPITQFSDLPLLEGQLEAFNFVYGKFQE